MEKEAKMRGKKHRKGGQEVIQNEVENGAEKWEGKVLHREGFWANMVPKIDPKTL